MAVLTITIYLVINVFTVQAANKIKPSPNFVKSLP